LSAHLLHPVKSDTIQVQNPMRHEQAPEAADANQILGVISGDSQPVDSAAAADASTDGRSQRLKDAEAAFLAALVQEEEEEEEEKEEEEEGNEDAAAGRRPNGSSAGRDRAAAEQRRVLAARLAAAARVIRKQASEEARTVTIATERLNVRQAPSSDATVLRKLPRGARVQVVGGHGPWLELAVQEAQTADQWAQGAGWILGRVDGASYALVE
jgi:hypothetical protein